MAHVETEPGADKYEVLEIIGKQHLLLVCANADKVQGRGAFALARKVRRRGDDMVRILRVSQDRIGS